MPGWKHINGSKEWHQRLVYCWESYLGVLPPSYLCVAIPAALLCGVAFGYWLFSLLCDGVWSLQSSCSLFSSKDFFFPLSAAGWASLHSFGFGDRSCDLKTINSFGCSAPSLHFSNMSREDCDGFFLTLSYEQTVYLRSFQCHCCCTFQLVDM